MMSWGNAVVVGAALAVGIVASRPRPTPVGAAAAPAPVTQHELVVPAIDGAPVLDGELGDSIWRGALARTGAFLDANGAPARPYSDARAVVVRDELVIALYAADEDIRTSGPLRDAFRVTVGTTTFEVSATGELRGAPPGTRIGHDLDGTVDDPSDDDEEWVIELAIPLAALGVRAQAGDRIARMERIAFAVDRCDTTHDGKRSCSTTRAVLVLDGKF
jgi:hypothetical protein